MSVLGYAQPMRTKRDRVTLTPAERDDLRRRIASGRAPARPLMHARILLKADTPDGEHGAFAEDLAAAVEASGASVERVRRRCVADGLAAARASKPATAPRVTTREGRGAAQLIALRCGAPPEGRARWTLHLLADRLVELQVVEAIAYETVRRTRKTPS